MALTQCIIRQIGSTYCLIHLVDGIMTLVIKTGLLQVDYKSLLVGEEFQWYCEITAVFLVGFTLCVGIIDGSSSTLLMAFATSSCII